MYLAKGTAIWKYLKLKVFAIQPLDVITKLVTSHLKKKKKKDIWQENLGSKCKFMGMLTVCHMEIGGGWYCSGWFTI